MKRLLVVLAMLVSIASVAFAGGAWRHKFRITTLNNTGVRADVVYVVQELAVGDNSAEPKVLREWHRRVRLGATDNGARKMFTMVRGGGVRRFIARPFERLPRGALGAPVADFQEFFTGDGFVYVTFSIGQPVQPPPSDYPVGINVVDGIAGTSYSQMFTTMQKDEANVVISSGDPRNREVQWSMAPTVVFPGYGTIRPGYFDSSLVWVGDVSGTYGVRVPISTGGTVSFPGVVYIRNTSKVVLTITAATKGPDGGSYLRRKPRVPTSPSHGTPVAPQF